MNLNDVMEMLWPAFELGCYFEVTRQDGLYHINLNTQAKSDCILVIEEDGTVKAKRRYGDVDTIECFMDILQSVVKCRCGREYFSNFWRAVLRKYQIDF